MKGRKPKPLSEHRLAGNPSKLDLDKLEAETPTPKAGPVEPPPGMGDRPRKLWDYYAPLLMARNGLSPENRECLAQMCVHQDNANEFQRAADGSDYVGLTKKECLREARAESTLALKFQVELGLTPSSIRRLGVSAQAVQEDELTKFRKRRERA